MRISKLLTFPRIILWAGAVSLLLALPTLNSGFVLDDYSILSIIEERYPDRETSFNLYGPLIEYVDVPWWTSADLEIAFFRPLSSALLRFDYFVAGRTPWVYYLHSLLWLVALLGVCGVLYSRCPGRAAAIAFVIFALDEFHSFTTGWISNRHAMVSLTLGLIGLWGHLRWREESWRPGLPVAILGFMAALTAGEVGIAMVGYAVAFELAGSPKGSPSRRWQALSYLTAIATAYALFYRSMGFGSSGGGAYLDPVGEPWIFLAAAIQRIPALLAGALAGVPPDAWMTETARPWLISIGLTAWIASAALLRAGWSGWSAEYRRKLRWLALGSFFALVPVVATVPGHRQLAAPMVGLAFVLGCLFDAAASLWRQSGHAHRLIAGAALGLLVLAHLIAAPLMRLAMQSNLVVLDRAVLSIVLPIVPESSRDASQKRWILANAPDFMTLFYGPAIYDYYRPAGAPLLDTWDVLSAAPHAHRLTRTGPKTLEIEVIDGQMLATSLEKVWPPTRPFVAGDIVASSNFDAEILAVADAGPTRVRYRFHDALDHGDLGLLIWSTAGLTEAAIPILGESLLLPHVPSPVRFPGAG